MVCYAYTPAPNFALITYTVWPEFLIPPRCPRQDAAVLSPQVQKIRRESAEYRHGRKGFILPMTTSMGTHDWPCVVVPHVSEVIE